MKLHLAPNFSLPPEAVTETFAILAKRGVGKTYTAKKMAEEMLKAAVAPVVVADPIGVWWGLRSSADGKGPGLPVLVLGGDCGDAPLDVGSGEIVARMLVEERLSAVLDLSKFRKNEQTQFMTAFAERLYHDNREALHLMLDEADAFAPQKPYKGQERLLGAIEDLVRRGRARGIGVTLITQRAAVINKDVLTQAEVLVALRTIAPQDRAAIEAWIRVHGTEEQGDELMASLPSLPVGTAWFWSPGWLDVFKRVEIAPIETFDSSATPKAGKAAKRPKNLAEVDIPAVRERLAATIEKAKAEDPKLLRAEIAQLRAELKKQAPPVSQPDPAATERMVNQARAQIQREAHRTLASMKRAMQHAVQLLRSAAEKLEASMPADVPLELPAPALPPLPTPRAQAAPNLAPRPAPRPAPASGSSSLSKAHRAILTALAQYPDGRTKTQLALLAGYAHNGGGFNNALSSLRTGGLITTNGTGIAITPEGLAALGPFEPLPTGAALQQYWMGQLSRAEREILFVLCELYPRTATKETIASRTPSQYEPSGGGFNNAISRLRTLGLIEGRGELQASADLFDYRDFGRGVGFGEQPVD